MSSNSNKLCADLAYFFILENSSQILKIKLSNIENSQGTSSSKANLILLRTEFSTHRSILEAKVSNYSSFQNYEAYMAGKVFQNYELLMGNKIDSFFFWIISNEIDPVVQGRRNCGASSQADFIQNYLLHKCMCRKKKFAKNGIFGTKTLSLVLYGPF